MVNKKENCLRFAFETITWSRCNKALMTWRFRSLLGPFHRYSLRPTAGFIPVATWYYESRYMRHDISCHVPAAIWKQQAESALDNSVYPPNGFCRYCSNLFLPKFRVSSFIHHRLLSALQAVGGKCWCPYLALITGILPVRYDCVSRVSGVNDLGSSNIYS